MCLALAGLWFQATAQTNDSQTATAWDRYQVIVDKNPFGRADADTVGVIPDFAKNLRLCMLSKIPDTAHPGRILSRAGFVGPVATNQFTVQEGELTEDGYSLEAVNHAEQKVKLRKGTETAEFTVEGLPVPTNTLAGSSRLQSLLQSPHAWRIFHEATRGPNGEITVPAHVHMPGVQEGANTRVMLSDDQAQELRRQREQFRQPGMTFPR